MKALGIANEDALQSYFIVRIGKFLAAHGRKLIGWDEILEGGVPPDATITSWRGVDGGIAAAKMGHDAVMSPAPVLYFDNRNGNGGSEPPGRGHVTSLEDVYNFDPAPAALSESERAHIIGVQGNIWTEHIRLEQWINYMAFPRAAALAEIAWSPAAAHNWQSFLTRLVPEMDRYRAVGIDAASSAFRPDDDLHLVPNRPGRRYSQGLKLCTERLPLNLEDDAPLEGPRARFLVDVMNPCWIFEKANLDSVASIVAAVGQVPFNFQLGQDVNKIVLRPPQTSEGELEVHLDTCDGARIAVLPLKSAAANDAVTNLSAPISPLAGRHDLCFEFTQRKLDPLWVIDWVDLVPKTAR
jgi:hexosaminidase